MRRTMLFLPGNTPNMLINGDTLGADTIILIWKMQYLRMKKMLPEFW